MYAAHVSKDERVHSLLCHAQETARLAGGFAGAFGAKEWGYPIGYYHDLGKSSPEFKRRLFEGGPKVDHSTAGAVHALSSLGLIGAYCIMGHHGGLPEGGTQTDVEGTSTVHGRPQKKLPKYDPNALPPPPFAAPKSPPFPLKDGFACSFFIRMLFSCLVDADYLSTEAFMENRPSAWGGYSDMETLKRRLDAHLAQFENPKELIRKKRNEILKDCRTAALGPRGLYTLTVPTGGGKTISSLAFAIDHALKHGFDRVIYVIPYTSIIEQNAGVFREIVGSENVVEHHASFTFDDEDPVSVRQRLATENWDAPLIVTTNVQFFESLFASATGRCRKLHSIARSVVIFDEAQMLPLDYVKPCTRAISELVQNYGVTAVLMSATQPALASFFPKDMPSFEMMKDPHELHEFFRRTTLCTLPPHSEEQLLEKLVGHEQVLCILNTRKRAQALYGRLPRDGGSFHLSTLMTPGHRSRKIDEIRKRLKEHLPCRVVSTSLIEAGVDLDFPAVFREEAGLDNLLQAAGRCNREACRPAEESFVYLFSFENGGTSRIPPFLTRAAATTRSVVRAYPDISSLEAIDSYFRDLYYQIGEGIDKKGILRSLSKAPNFPFPKVSDAFQLIENNTYPVIVPLGEEGERLAEKLRAGERSRALFRQAGQYTVNVYHPHLTALHEARAIEQLESGAFLLADMRLYSGDTGLALAPDQGAGIFA